MRGNLTGGGVWGGLEKPRMRPQCLYVEPVANASAVPGSYVEPVANASAVPGSSVMVSVPGEHGPQGLWV